MKWRTRVIIELNSPLSTDEFLVQGYSVRTRPEYKNNQWPNNYHMIDILHEDYKDKDPENAHIIGVDTASIFIDRLSAVTYNPCRLIHIVSTSPEHVETGVSFNIVTHNLVASSRTDEVIPENIQAFERLDKNNILHESSHHVRLALSESSVEQHLLHLYIAVETIGTSEATDRVKNTCPACKHEWDGPLATSSATKSILTKRGVSNKDAKKAVKIRGRIAHGGGGRNTDFYEEVTELAGAIEGAVVSTVAERVGLNIKKRRGAIVGLPMTTHEAVKNDDGTFSINVTSWKAPIRFPELGEDISEPKGECRVGCPTDENGRPIIDPAAWPN